MFCSDLNYTLSIRNDSFYSLLIKQKCLELKQTVGMIGGKPNQAYYFYGYAGKNDIQFKQN